MLLANARDKLQGFKEVFCNKKLDFQGLDIEVDLYYYNKESSVLKDFEGHIITDLWAICIISRATYLYDIYMELSILSFQPFAKIEYKSKCVLLYH